MSERSTTFGGWSDRLTYLLAEGQLVALGLLFSGGVALWLWQPSIPRVPPVTQGILAALLLFGPPLFGLFVSAIRKLRRRHMVTVYHVNAVNDVLKKWYVSPDEWSEKSVDGPNPYPVNGGAAWVVQEFEHLEDVGELRVKGVWLSETEDTQLLTKKSHMEAIYSKLTESHIALNIMRDSVSELGADIQRRIINATSEARERGEMMDKAAVKEVFEDFEDESTGLGSDDLPTLEVDESLATADDEPALQYDEPAGPDAAIGTEAPADD